MTRILLILATLYVGYSVYKRIYAWVCPACGQRMKKNAVACPTCNRPINADEAIEATVLPEGSTSGNASSDDRLMTPLSWTLVILTIVAVAATFFLAQYFGKA